MEDKLQELYKNISGEYDLPDYATFQKDMQDPVKLGKLHKTLSDDNYEVPEFQTFQRDMFPEKKKATPEQGDGSPASTPQPKTGSEGTPQSKPAVSPAKPTYLYGGTETVETPAAGENTPLAGLGGAPVTNQPAAKQQVQQPLQKVNEEAKGMKEIFQKFQDYRNQTTIQAQENFLKEAAGDIEYRRSKRKTNPDWAEEQQYKMEDLAAEKRAASVSTQPLVTKMLDYYQSQAGGKEAMDSPIVSSAVLGALSPVLGADRDDAPVEKLKEQLIGTPEGASLEQELQKMYKRTDLNDKEAVDNAMLDAKQLFFEKLGDKDVTIWDDFAQTNADMADYNPVGYHKRLEGQIEKRYGAAGMDKDVAYKKLLDHTLNRGVMDEERTLEARAVMNLDNIREEVSRARDEGSAFRIQQAEEKLAKAEREVKAMEDSRLASFDEKIAGLQDAYVNEQDAAAAAAIKKELDTAKAQRAGFINPQAKVAAAYAKYGDKADAVMPSGTPLQKLKKLLAELEFDRQQIAGRITKAESKGGDIGFAANEMLNLTQGHNADHRRMVQLEAQIKDLAPIAFLNENPGVTDKKAGFFPAFNTGFMGSLAGQGSPLSNTQRQEDAINLARNLQIAGVSPEALYDPTMTGVKDRMEEPGFFSGEYLGGLAGQSTGLMASIMATTAITRGVGLGTAVSRAVQLGNKALGLTGKYSGAILPLLGDALESGINYEAAGRINVDNDDELDFVGGFLGGAAASVGSSGFNALKSSVARFFGDKAQDAANMVINFGASRLGSGVGETAEEFGQQIGQLWEQSSTGQDFWRRMDEQFGTVDKTTKFIASTMLMGAFMGGAHSGGLGEYLTNYSQQQLDALPPEQREVTQEFVDQIVDEQAAFVEGGLNSTPEDVAAAEEGIEPEKKKELTPEAQAAQAELERRAAIDKTMVEQGLGDRVNTAQSQEDRIREERDSLIAQQERQELTDNEKKRLAELETVVTGLDQIAAGEQFASPAPEVQTEAKPEVVVTTSGETIKPVEGSDTKKKVTIDVGGTPMEIEFDTEGLGEDLETFQATLTPDAKDAFVESPAQTEETVVEENPFGDPTPREQPKRRDEQIVDQINEFFSSLAGTISENSADKLKEYARRILSGEDAAKVMQGQTPKSIELVNQAVASIQQQETTPATDESIIDVTGEAPTPIAAEETVVAESPAPKGKPIEEMPSVNVDDTIAYANDTGNVKEGIKSQHYDDVRTNSGKELIGDIRGQMDRQNGREGRDAGADVLNRGDGTYEVHVGVNGSAQGRSTAGGIAIIVKSEKVAKMLAKMLPKIYQAQAEKYSPMGAGKLSNEKGYDLNLLAENNAEITKAVLEQVNSEIEKLNGKVREANKGAQGAANGGESKPRANPNRKTKAKPVADLTPTEVVSEAIAVNAEVDENPTPENQDRQAEIEERIDNQVAPTNEVATEAEVVAESPAQTPKPKKSRGKEKPLPEGVEDMFTEARVSGRRTSWMKKDGKWLFRNHKPGTKISEQQFERDWQEATGKDIERAERMAAMDPLTRELANSAKEWVTAWGDLVTLRNPYGKGDGKVFASVDLGIVGNSIKLGAKTAKVGINLARVLAQNGVYTYENWKNGMVQALGEHVLPFLDQAWESVKTIIPEGSTSADIQTNVVEDQANEKTQDVKKKSGRQATTDTMREFSGTNPTALNAALAAVDDTYEVMSIKGIFAEALAAVKKAGGFANPDVWADLLSEKEGEAKVLHHVKRMLAIRFYGELADQLQERMGDEATQEEMDAYEKAVDNMVTALELVKNNNTWSGKQTAAMSEWRMVMANTVGYVKSQIEKYNAELLKSPRKGKAIKRKAKETKEQLNDIREQDGQEVAKSSALDSAIENVVEQTVPKKKKPAEGAKKERKAGGKTSREIADMKAKAREDMAKAARAAMGQAGALAVPAAFDFMDALGRYGYAVVLEGVVTFKDWSAKMKSELPDVTDEQLREAWDQHEEDGKTISEHSKDALTRTMAPTPPRKKGEPTLRRKIRDTISAHFKKDAEPKTLEQRLMDDVGLTVDEAAHIVETVKAELEARTKAKVEARAKALKKKPPRKPGQTKTDSQRAIEAMVDGEFTDEMVQEIFADRLGLQAQLTPEQMATVRSLGKALEATKPNTRAQTVAAMALDRYMYEVLPPPGKAEMYWDLFKSIIYSNMLMGLPTHMKNLVSSGAMTVSSIVEILPNISKWKRSLRQAWKAKDGEKIRTLMRSNPITEMFVKLSALGRGWYKGAEIAWDIMVHGTMDSKYVDSGKANIGRLSPTLERYKFSGKYNPLNAFKYVGRALAAEDAWMYSINNEMELADATRRHFLEATPGDGVSFTRDVQRRMAFSNPLYNEAHAEATQEIEALDKALGFTPKELKRAINIRAREILVDKIGLTEEEMQQAEDISRSRVFTLKRNGIWGQTASLMAKINAHPIAGKVSWIWMPFANIIGNVGDTFNDYYPGYGVIRANGVSPTALLRSMGRGSASMSDTVEGTLEERIKKSMGGRQDQKYYEQMGRAWIGSMSMLAALLLMDDDDKDDFIRFTGKNDPTHKNYLMIGGQPIMTWELIPSVAPVAAIMSEAHSFHKLHPEEKRSFQARMLYAMGSVEQSVAGLSVAESVQNLNQVIGTVLSSLTGVGNYGDKVDLEKGLKTLRDELGKQGIDMLSRVNPLRNPVVGQIQQIFDPRVFSHSDIRQTLDYAYQGVIYRYADDENGNPRMAMVDIFGDEVKKFPAEESFAFLSFANEKVKEKKWKFLADHGGIEIMSRTSNRNWLMDDDESEYGVISRKLTDKEFGTYARLAGKKFAKELERYMANESQWKKDYKAVVTTTGGTMTGLQKKVMEMASKARTAAKKELNALPVSKGGLGGKAL